MSAQLPGCLIVVAAPSGAGKTTLVRALLERDRGIDLSISHTTRAPRGAEQDGLHYHFVTRERFLEMVEAGAFLEHADVFGNCYGTARATVEARLAAGRDVLLEIDYQGARQVRERYPNAVSAFILPPSFEVLMQRLRKRGEDSPAAIARRSAAAREEIAHSHEFDYLVINDDLSVALDDLSAIMRAERLRRDRQSQRHRALLDSLMDSAAASG